MALSHSPRIVTNGLVLCLDAGNTKSYAGIGTVWNDLSGRGNTGTLTNGPTYSSSNGGSLSFDGTNDYVDLGTTSLSSTLSSLTINLFVKILKINSKQAFISSFTSSPQGGWGIELLLNNTINFFGFTNTTTFTDVQTNQTLSLNQLVNITCVYGNSTFSIYINGTLNASKSGVSTIYKTSNVYLASGNVSTPNIIPLNGNISQVSIYNRALTAAEIQQNFNALRGRYGI